MVTARRYIVEKIKLEDLPDHLKHFGLTIEKVEVWQKRGWLMRTEEQELESRRAAETQEVAE